MVPSEHAAACAQALCCGGAGKRARSGPQHTAGYELLAARSGAPLTLPATWRRVRRQQRLLELRLQPAVWKALSRARLHALLQERAWLPATLDLT